MIVSQANDLRDEAFRKIGRNLVNFQRMERALKLLLILGDMNGDISEMVKISQNRLRQTKHTMGTLADKLIDILYSAADTNPDLPDNLKGVWVSFSFRIKGGAEKKRATRKALALVVQERNLLVHEMLGDFDSASVEDCRALIESLDQQQELITPHFELIMGWLRTLHEGQMKLLEILKDGKLLESEMELRAAEQRPEPDRRHE